MTFAIQFVVSLTNNNIQLIMLINLLNILNLNGLYIIAILKKLKIPTADIPVKIVDQVLNGC